MVGWLFRRRKGWKWNRVAREKAICHKSVPWYLLFTYVRVFCVAWFVRGRRRRRERARTPLLLLLLLLLAFAVANKRFSPYPSRLEWGRVIRCGSSMNGWMVMVADH